MPPDAGVARGNRAKPYRCPRCGIYRSRGPWWCDFCNSIRKNAEQLPSYQRHGVSPSQNHPRTVGELERRVYREPVDWEVECHARGPLKPEGVFVLQVLKLGPFNRDRLKRMIREKHLENGKIVTTALIQRGVIEEYGSDVRLTRKGEFELRWIPNLDPELKQIVTEPSCKAAHGAVNELDWITLVKVRRRCYTIERLPQEWMTWHAEGLIKRGLIRKSNGLLELTEKGDEFLLPEIYPGNPRAGNRWHRWKIVEMAREFQRRLFHTHIDFGRLAVSQPDITVTPVSYKTLRWEKHRQFACEAERNPVNHPDNVRDNYFRNVAFGLLTLFVVLIERHRDAVIKAIAALKDPKVLERTIKRAHSLDAEQIQRATDWIRKHPPKMVTPNRLTGRHCRPTTFAVEVEQVFKKPTSEQIKMRYKKLMQTCEFEIQRRKNSYYLTRRIGRRYKQYDGKIEPWLARWLIKRGAKCWKKA